MPEIKKIKEHEEKIIHSLTNLIGKGRYSLREIISILVGLNAFFSLFFYLKKYFSLKKPSNRDFTTTFSSVLFCSTLLIMSCLSLFLWKTTEENKEKPIKKLTQETLKKLIKAAEHKKSIDFLQNTLLYAALYVISCMALKHILKHSNETAIAEARIYVQYINTMPLKKREEFKKTLEEIINCINKTEQVSEKIQQSLFLKRQQFSDLMDESASSYRAMISFRLLVNTFPLIKGARIPLNVTGIPPISLPSAIGMRRFSLDNVHEKIASLSSISKITHDFFIVLLLIISGILSELTGSTPAFYAFIFINIYYSYHLLHAKIKIYYMDRIILKETDKLKVIFSETNAIIRSIETVGYKTLKIDISDLKTRNDAFEILKLYSKEFCIADEKIYMYSTSFAENKKEIIKALTISFKTRKELKSIKQRLYEIKELTKASNITSTETYDNSTGVLVIKFIINNSTTLPEELKKACRTIKNCEKKPKNLELTLKDLSKRLLDIEERRLLTERLDLSTTSKKRRGNKHLELEPEPNPSSRLDSQEPKWILTNGKTLYYSPKDSQNPYHIFQPRTTYAFFFFSPELLKEINIKTLKTIMQMKMVGRNKQGIKRIEKTDPKHSDGFRYKAKVLGDKNFRIFAIQCAEKPPLYQFTKMEVTH